MLSSGLKAALIPPCAAPEWLLNGCNFVKTATFLPATFNSLAAAKPAKPAPTTIASYA